MTVGVLSQAWRDETAVEAVPAAVSGTCVLEYEVVVELGAVLVGILDPGASLDMLSESSSIGVTALAVDAVPRISLVQSRGAPNSTAGIVGYRPVTGVAERS
jgi:NAD/NADP transhydrogenase alpha subunit